MNAPQYEQAIEILGLLLTEPCSQKNLSVIVKHFSVFQSIFIRSKQYLKVEQRHSFKTDLESR